MYQIVSHPDRIIADLGLAWRTNVAGGFPWASLHGRRTVTFLRRLVSSTDGRRGHAMARARRYGPEVGTFRQGGEADRHRRIQRLHAWQLHVALQKLLGADIKNHKLRSRFRWRNCRCIAGPNPPELLKLETPLAVQGMPPLPGFFPSTSSVPRPC